jgi:Cellulase (glycosyl hydrolase family 5)
VHRRGALTWILSLLLVGLVSCGMALTSARRAGSAKLRTPCGDARAVSHTRSALTVVGNHMVDSRGDIFVPYGISLVGGPENHRWAWTEKGAVAQVIASHRFWHANAVRIQVSEALLFGRPTPGYDYNRAFAASVNRLVCRILGQGQIPIINDTTLFTARSRGPTQQTVRFWRFMSQRYGDRLPVIFDLFNEPRLGRNPRTKRFVRLRQVWRVWERGGRLAGKKYLGMQALVDTIRIRERVHNVIWAEEPWYLDPEKLPTSELPEHLLRGLDIVYAFHKVGLDDRSRSFRALAAVAARGIPLVDSEWSQFAATDRPWECQDDARAGVPRFLRFLRQVPIGLVVWSLQPGALVKGQPGVDTVNDGNDFRFTTNPYDLATPNVMRPGYGCNPVSRGQGAGALVQSFFAQYNVRAPVALFPRFY